MSKEESGGDIRSLILSDASKKQFAAALPKHLTPDRFVRIALTALTKNPKLMQCTKASLLACLLDCSQLGLEPDGRKAHLIPYGDKCTLIIDYKGLVDLAYRPGKIADIHADVVYENDVFEYEFGSNSKLIHKPTIKERGAPIAAYSFVKLKDGSSSFEVMNEKEIEGIHQRSKAANNGPWVTDRGEMTKKTVFRRHSKWLPVSSEFQDAIDKDYDSFPALGKTPLLTNDSLMPKAIDVAAEQSKEKEEPAEAPKKELKKATKENVEAQAKEEATPEEKAPITEEARATLNKLLVKIYKNKDYSRDDAKKRLCEEYQLVEKEEVTLMVPDLTNNEIQAEIKYLEESK